MPEATQTPAAAERGFKPPIRRPQHHGLADLRVARKLSLRDLQEATGINRGLLSQMERGRLIPEPEHLAALSHALGVPVESWRIRFVLETESL